MLTTPRHRPESTSTLSSVLNPRPTNAVVSRLVYHQFAGGGREVVDDVVAVLAADQDAALGPWCADPQARLAAVQFGGRAVGEVGHVALASVDHGEADRAGAVEHLLERRYD